MSGSDTAEPGAMPDMEKEFWLSALKDMSDAFTSALSSFEGGYGDRPYSKEVIQWVRDAIPRLLTKHGILSLALENVLLKQDVAAVRKEKARLLSVIDLLWRNEASVETDSTGVIVSINRRLLEISGYSEDELIGKNMSVFHSWVHDQGFWKGFWDTIKSGSVWEGNVCEKAKDWSLFWLHTVVSPVLEGGKVVSFQIVSHDVTELERLRHVHAAAAASMVHLQTGLPNRNQLVEDLKVRTYPTLAVVHVNHMIEVNNAYGPEMGDNVLVAVGWRLAGLFRSKGGEAYKLEGADFAIVCPENATAESIAQFLSHLNELEIAHEGSRIPLSFSVGIVSDGSDGKEMLMRAYIALHQSRERGEPAVLFDSTLLTSAFFREGLEMVSLVKYALEKDLFVPFYQEIHDNAPYASPRKKVECLVRMFDPADTVSVIAPGKFLTAAKKGGHLRSITRVMVEKTFAHLAETDTEFSINLSADDVTDLTFVDFIRESIVKFGMRPSRVIFEILEGIDTSKSELMVAIAHELKSLGCKIAIDDFGSDNANLTRMIDFAADYIKIDMKYVRWIDTNPRNESLLRHIIGYAHENNILVIAEGVETQEEQEVLVRLGADYSQGYLFSRPAPTV